MRRQPSCPQPGKGKRRPETPQLRNSQPSAPHPYSPSNKMISPER
jgi:hypothetical protein